MKWKSILFQYAVFSFKTIIICVVVEMVNNPSATVKCKKCQLELGGSPNSPFVNRVTCPNCGSTERAINVFIQDEGHPYASIRAKSFSPNSRKFQMDVISGEIKNKDGKIVKKTRVIDRAKNLYSEKIVDQQGNVLRETNERLTDHKGHGSANLSKKKNNKSR